MSINKILTLSRKPLITRWSEEMTNIVEENIHYMPNVIMRKLKSANELGRKIPTKTQLYNKMSAIKKAACPRMS